MFRRLALLALLAAAAAAAVACATNPATGRRQLMFVSSQDEIAMGRQAVPGVISEFGEIRDGAVNEWVRGIGRDLAKTTEQPNLPFTFTVLDSPVVNAFALPGGPVFVTRGLIAYANDEAELSGVVGHEIGHVVGRHGAEQASRGQALGGLLVLGSIVNETIGRYAPLLGSGAQLLLLQNSRDAEREADLLGVRYAARAGYDPLGVSRYMQVLDTLAKQSSSVLPNWLSTHPDPGERAETTRRLAAEAPLVANAKVNREALLLHVDGLVFGDDPREGFQKGRTFHVPALEFRFDLPEGWASINTRQTVLAIDNREKPATRLQLQVAPQAEGAPRDPGGYVAFLQGKSPDVQFAGAPGRINGLDAWTGRVLVPDQKGSKQEISAAWISHGGTLYQFIAAGADRAAAERSIRSFRPETDPAVLGVKPVVVRLATPRGGTLAQFCQSRSGELGAPCAELATLNRLRVQDVIPAGQSVKVPTRQGPLYP